MRGEHSMKKGFELKTETKAVETIHAEILGHERDAQAARRSGRGALAIAHLYTVRALKAEIRKLEGKPGRLTIASVRAVLKRSGCTVEEGASEFLVDPPAGMGFDDGELSQRVFGFADYAADLDPDSRRSTLEHLYEWAQGVAGELAPWKADGDYEDAIRETLRALVATELGGVDWRHVEARIREAHENVEDLTTDEFQTAILDAYKIATVATPAENEAVAKRLGL